MKFSIVIPVFNEPSENIKELYDRITCVCSHYAYIYEIVFVDDGSANNILVFLQELRGRDSRVKVISLDRNYGQSCAFVAGFYFSTGDFILTMDGDLQYQPEDIPLFIDKITDGYDAVGGKRENLSRGFLSLCLTFYFNLLGMRMEDHTCSYAMVSRAIAQRIIYNEASTCLKHLAYMFAGKKIEIGIRINQRKHGRSSYTPAKYLRFGVHYLTAFSRRFREVSVLPFRAAVVLTGD